MTSSQQLQSIKVISMKRLIPQLALSLSMAAGLMFAPVTSHAAEKKAAPAAETPKPRARPVMGKVEAVDKVMKTITLSGEKQQVLQVTSETKITKAGKPAIFDDVAVGEEIAGSAIEENGKLALRSLRVGPKPEAVAKPEKPAKPEAEAKGINKAKKQAKDAAEKAPGN
jgi:hypothetical protein